MAPNSHTTESTTTITAAVGTMVGTVLAAFWEGGQRTARRNAWQGVRADQIHAAERAEANRALDALTARDNDPTR